MKQYDHKKIEKKWQTLWQKKGVYKTKESSKKPKKFVLDKTERQLRQIGRGRAKHLYNWLLEADLALKGVSSSGDRARLVLEQLIVRLSAPAASAATFTGEAAMVR